MTSLDQSRTMRSVDRSAMLDLLVSFPSQCREAAAIGRSAALARPAVAGRIQAVVSTGLGGSAIGADLARSYLADELRVPFIVNRNYTLPQFVGRQTLVLVSSYSGNTEETISAYKDARARHAERAVITSGGTIAALARRDDVTCVMIPQGFPPRCALGYAFFPLLALLTRYGLIADQSPHVDEAIRVMQKLVDTKIGPTVPEKKNIAKKIARFLYNHYPIIYAGQDHIDTIATRWRGQIAENAKTLGSHHVLPEMNHNEIVGWDCPAHLMRSMAVVFLCDRDDHSRIARRMEVTRRILAREGIHTMELASIGDCLLARIFSLVYIGDFVSFYLAILNKRDPTPVERIAYLKKELAKR